MSEQVKMGRWWWKAESTKLIRHDLYVDEYDGPLGDDRWITRKWTPLGWHVRTWVRRIVYWYEEW